MESLLTPEQLQTRRSGIGSSDVPAIFGIDPFRNALDVYLSKVGKAPAFAGNTYTQWGNRLEEPIAQAYADLINVSGTAFTLRSGNTIRHPTLDLALCTPDRLVYGPSGKDPLWGLEIKNKSDRSRDDWGPDGSTLVPPYVEVQVRWQLMIAHAIWGVSRWDVAALFGGNELRIYHLRRDAEWEDTALERVLSFWNHHVLPQIPPDMRPLQAGEVWEEGGKVKDDMKETDDPAVLAAVQRLQSLTHQMAQVEEDIEGTKAFLQGVIGDFKGLQGPWGKITWGMSKGRTTVDWKNVANALLPLVDQDLGIRMIELNTNTGKPYRSFRPNFNKQEAA